MLSSHWKLHQSRLILQQSFLKVVLLMLQEETLSNLCIFFILDIYVCLVSSTHNVASNNHYIAMVSTTVETSNPEAELIPGLQLLGPIQEKFVSVSDIYHPVDSGEENKVCLC